MRKIAVVAVLVALISVLAGVAGAAAQDSSGEDEKVVFRVGGTNDIDGFNPFKIVEIPSYEVMGLTYDLLVDTSPKDSSPVPGLADSWETSDDGLTWTFHLNKDARWHDGKPVTSEDVAYTYQRILDEEQGLYIDAVKQIDSIETPDKHTVVFTTKKPSVQMLNTYVYILPKHIWKDVPADETKSFKNEPVIGSGPFQAMEWREGQFARLEANPDYFRGAPHVDEVIFQFYDNADTMVQALKNGEVDYIYNMPINLFKSLENQEGIDTNSAPDPGFTELGFNLYEPTPEAIEEFGAPKTTTGNPALLDPLVREAINWAIDEEALTDKILQGEGVAGSTLVPPALANYHLELPESEVQGFDIERSKELLAEAGWEDTNGDGTVDKDGEELAAAPVLAHGGCGLGHPGRVPRRLVQEGRDRARDQGHGRHGPHRRHLRRRLRHVHLGLGLGGGSRLHPLGAHLRPDHGLVGHVLVQRRVLWDVRGAERATRPRRAGRHHKGDAADRLRGQSVRDPLLRQPARGLAHGQVRRLEQDPVGRRPRPGGLHVHDQDLHGFATPERGRRWR